jgi:hypothetical protein
MKLLFPTLAYILAAGTALAEPEFTEETVEACMQTQAAAGASPAECVSTVMSECIDFGFESPASAVLCFRNAGTAWGDLLKQALSKVEMVAPAQVYTFAEINTRYDLMKSLLECDRIKEMAIASDQDGNAINVQDARCQATATGLTYLKVTLQLRARQ